MSSFSHSSGVWFLKTEVPVPHSAVVRSTFFILVSFTNPQGGAGEHGRSQDNPRSTLTSVREFEVVLLCTFAVALFFMVWEVVSRQHQSVSVSNGI